MRKKLIPLLIALVVTVTFAGAVGANAGNNGKAKDRDWHSNPAMYRTSLRGNQEVPANGSSMTGWLVLRHDSKRDRMPFTLTAYRGEDIVAAHLHCAVAGQNGPVVAVLMGDVPGGLDISGQIVRSYIEDDNINKTNGATCPTSILDVESLAAAINKGEVYVNIHSVSFPNGEIRGQVKSF